MVSVQWIAVVRLLLSVSMKLVRSFALVTYTHLTPKKHSPFDGKLIWVTDVHFWSWTFRLVKFPPLCSVVVCLAYQRAPNYSECN